ncbi:MAG: biotin--[acetyl-CoA-carboxylase] ligase [Spirochaetales bacterium]|jgi:BirA family biotin operon repressor/biotin-[acetyl-CoA-carboxylase] ligase
MDFIIARYPEVDSTMDEAKRLAGNAKEPRLIVLAERQTAGRGRIEGRSWTGSAGASMLMTLCLRGDFSSVAAMPLRIGLAVRDVLSEFGNTSATFQVKWPNDVMGMTIVDNKLNGYRKLGGLLCEVSNGWLFAGIGLNVKKSAYPKALAASATSMEEALDWKTGEIPASFPGMSDLALAIGQAAAAYLEKKEWRGEYLRAMWSLGEEIFFSIGHPEIGQTRVGRIEGVDDSGRLLLRGEDGELEAYWSGEISGLRNR